MTRVTSATVIAAILAAGVAGGVGLQKALGARAPQVAQDRPEVSQAARQLQESFNRAAEYATKSVVHITTVSEPFMDADTGLPMGAAQQSIGSGVIVSKEGHILTNEHVVQGSRTPAVRFGDGREYKADIVGQDWESDLALLKIRGADGVVFQPLEFADSDAARAGDWVLAIGSPFGYNHSVSAGIVSAKHRVANVEAVYKDFIQTDAAINPGNSGGALVDLNGRLVGINAAIVSQSRTFEGIGLAISSNLARFVLGGLMTPPHRVRRGFIGVLPRDLDADLVRELRQNGIRTLDDLMSEVGLEAPRGVFLARVDKGPAATAGLRFGDVLLELDGKRIPHMQALFFQIAGMTPGKVVKAKYLRDRKEKEVEIEIGERPEMPRRPRTR